MCGRELIDRRKRSIVHRRGHQVSVEASWDLIFSRRSGLAHSRAVASRSPPPNVDQGECHLKGVKLVLSKGDTGPLQTLTSPGRTLPDPTDPQDRYVLSRHRLSWVVLAGTTQEQHGDELLGCSRWPRAFGIASHVGVRSKHVSASLNH